MRSMHSLEGRDLKCSSRLLLINSVSESLLTGRCTRGGMGRGRDEGGAVDGGAGMSDMEIGIFMAVDSRVEDWSLRVEGTSISW